MTFADSGPAIPGGMDIFEPLATENVRRTAERDTDPGLAITNEKTPSRFDARMGLRLYDTLPSTDDRRADQ